MQLRIVVESGLYILFGPLSDREAVGEAVLAGQSNPSQT